MTKQFDPGSNIGNLVYIDQTLKDHFNTVFANQDHSRPVVTLEIMPGGCSGFEYEWKTHENYQFDFEDWIFKGDKFYLVIPKTSHDYIKGSKISYTSSITGGKIEIDNPNAVISCGCGESITFKEPQ